MKNDLTYFEVIQKGDQIKAVATRNGKVIREKYCLTWKQAEIVRRGFVNEFWGWKLN